MVFGAFSTCCSLASGTHSKRCKILFGAPINFVDHSKQDNLFIKKWALEINGQFLKNALCDFNMLFASSLLLICLSGAELDTIKLSLVLP